MEKELKNELDLLTKKNKRVSKAIYINTSYIDTIHHIAKERGISFDDVMDTILKVSLKGVYNNNPLIDILKRYIEENYLDLLTQDTITYIKKPDFYDYVKNNTGYKVLSKNSLSKKMEGIMHITKHNNDINKKVDGKTVRCYAIDISEAFGLEFIKMLNQKQL